MELASADESAANGDAAPLDPEDRVLVERILAGDEDAFRDLVEKFHRRVAAVVRRYAGGRSGALEDHAQEVFLRVYRGLPTFQGSSSLGTWIHRIAVNYLITDLRKRRALKRDQRTLSIDAPIGGADSDLKIEVVARGSEPSAAVFDGERGVVIRRAMEELEEDLRRIVLLREIEQRSYEEIAEIVDIPIGTVRSRLHRARGILQERLRPLL
ncbi:MAG: sigma-70 family RNA polymerase sigma factor [Planctomycetes bacterium]|nr:sigma-70 family RNA polymerase sigma factor [Planctomycetota bacterium]